MLSQIFTLYTTPVIYLFSRSSTSQTGQRRFRVAYGAADANRVRKYEIGTVIHAAIILSEPYSRDLGFVRATAGRMRPGHELNLCNVFMASKAPHGALSSRP